MELKFPTTLVNKDEVARTVTKTGMVGWQWYCIYTVYNYRPGSELLGGREEVMATLKDNVLKAECVALLLRLSFSRQVRSRSNLGEGPVQRSSGRVNNDVLTTRGGSIALITHLSLFVVVE